MKVSPLFFLSGIGMIVVGVAFKVDTLSHVWILELIVAMYCSLGLWGLVWIRKRSSSAEAIP